MVHILENLELMDVGKNKKNTDDTQEGLYLEIFVTGLLFLAFTGLRAAVLLATPFPPSGDVAGDIYNANAWLGHSINGIYGQAPLSPPLYYFLIVLPFIHIFGVFKGAEIYMSFVPALLVFPGYLITKNLTRDRLYGMFGGALIGGASVFSLMVSWNAAYNLFGIFFMLFFIYYLQKSYEKRRVKYLSITGFFFALVVGTHALTALVSFITFLISAVLLLSINLVKRSNIRPTMVSIVLLFGFMVLFSTPFFFLYYKLFSVSIVSGLSNPSSFKYYLENFLSFPWGLQGPKFSLIYVVDVIISILSLLSIFFLKPELKSPMIGLLLSLLILPLVETANAVRFLYFLAIVFLLSTPLVFKDSNEIVKHFLRRAKMSLNRSKQYGIKAFVIALLLLFVLLNSSFSYTLLGQASNFYKTLSPEQVKVLNWIKYNTTSNSSVYDTTGIPGWILAYSDRMAYSPGSLTNQVTSSSYNQTYYADLIDLGNYVLSNKNFALGFNYGSAIGDPEVYLLGPTGFTEFSIAATDNIFLNFTHDGKKYNFSLNYANPVSMKEGSNQILSWMNFTFLFPNQGVFVFENISINERTYSLNFYSNNSKIESIEYGFSILPNGYGFNYVNLRSYNGRSLSDSISFSGENFIFNVNSSFINQSVSSNGWTSINVLSNNSISFDLSVSTFSGTSSTLFINTVDLLHILNISYILANYNDYPFFNRFFANSTSFLGTSYIVKAKFGSTYIFEVEYNASHY